MPVHPGGVDCREETDNKPRRSLGHRILHDHEFGLWVLFVMLCLILYFLAWREMRFFMVPSRSMEPTLFPGDMIVTMGEKQYKRGDIVVWKDNREYVVKRVIGLPGDSISVVDGALFINGKYASEPYILEPMRYFIEYPVTIPEGRFFYLGDNRNMSEDSSLGFVQNQGAAMSDNDPEYLGSIDAIIGRVVFTYYPYDRFGPVNSFPLRNTAEL